VFIAVTEPLLLTVIVLEINELTELVLDTVSVFVKSGVHV